MSRTTQLCLWNSLQSSERGKVWAVQTRPAPLLHTVAGRAQGQPRAAPHGGCTQPGPPPWAHRSPDGLSTGPALPLLSGYLCCRKGAVPCSHTPTAPAQPERTRTPTHPHSHPQALQQCSPRGRQLSRDATQADTAQQMDIPPHPRSVRSSTESLQPPIAAGHGAATQPTGTIRPAPMAVGTAALSAVGHGHKPQKPQPRSGPAPSVPVAAAAQQLP